MATANCTLSYVRTMDKGTNESSATYHFGYGKAGQHWCTCYKVTVPSYTGTPSSITFTLSVNRGTAYTSPSSVNSTWKLGLDESAPVWSAGDGAYTAGSAYADGEYDKTGSWYNTFTGSIGSSNVSKTVTITTSSAILDSGNTFYVYLFSGANTANSIKVASISAYVTYSSETVTGTTLYVGTTSTPTSTTAYPTPSKRTVYWKVNGLQYQVKEYTKFYLYKSNSFSFTNGQSSPPSGYIDSYNSSTNTATYFTKSFTIPDTDILIGSNTGVVCIAQNASGCWRIGGSGNTPKTCYIHPKAEDWFLNAVNCSAKITGKNSVTYTYYHKVSNNPKYIKWFGTFTSNVRYDEEGFDANSTSIWDSDICSLNIADNSSATAYSQSETRLSAGTTYTRYFLAGAHSESPYYALNDYYGLGKVSFTTDDEYSATISANVNGATTATLSMSDLNSTINLLGATWIVSTTNVESTKDISSFKNCFECDTGSGGSSSAEIYEFTSPEEYTVSCTGLSPATEYTMYAYVYSEESGNWYKCGSVTFKTHGYVYYGNNLTPCWTYMLVDGVWTQVLLDAPSYISS